MAEGVNVRLSGKLQEFVRLKNDPQSGVFNSASEYIRDLIRHDYELDQASKWEALRQEFAPGATADESEFVPLDAEAIRAEARQRRGE